MTTSTWRPLVEAELKQAEFARAVGNEGMARVCARRAAGIIIGEYLDREGFSHNDRSAYGRLKIIQDLPGVSKKVRQTARHFLLRINPDHSLPLKVDLLAEARWLAKELLQEELEGA